MREDDIELIRKAQERKQFRIRKINPTEQWSNMEHC